MYGYCCHMPDARFYAKNIHIPVHIANTRRQTRQRPFGSQESDRKSMTMDTFHLSNLRVTQIHLALSHELCCLSILP